MATNKKDMGTLNHGASQAQNAAPNTTATAQASGTIAAANAPAAENASAVTPQARSGLAPAQPSGYLALAQTDFAAMVSEETDGLDLSFDKIKIPSAGSTVFEVPAAGNLDGDDRTGDDTDMVKEFSAVILHHHTLNCYYKTKYTGANNPPDCGSIDGITGTSPSGDIGSFGGEGEPSGFCKTCPLNQFGTAEEGSGKACKNRRRIYVLREGEVFPLLLSLPTGSLKEFTRYIKRLLSKGRRANTVVTRFSLQKANSSTGVVYSQAQFAAVRTLTAEEQALINDMSAQVKAYSGRVAFEYESTDYPDLTDHVAPGTYVDPDTGEVIEPIA